MGHCDEALKKIGSAIIAYQQANENQNPASLEKLTDNKLTVWELVCPASPFSAGECSYVYRGEDLNGSVPEEMILAYDKQPWHKGRRNILFADGSVRRPPEKVFTSFIKKDNEMRLLLALPEKSIRL